MSSIRICVSKYAPTFAKNLLKKLVNDVKRFLQKLIFD